MKTYEKFGSRYSEVTGNCLQFLTTIPYDYIVMVESIYISSQVATEIYPR